MNTKKFSKNAHQIDKYHNTKLQYKIFNSISTYETLQFYVSHFPQDISSIESARNIEIYVNIKHVR